VRSYLVSESRIITAEPGRIFDLIADPARRPAFDGSGAVVELDEPRQIAWRHWSGQIWRYLLEPVPEGTRVTEQWDARRTRGRALLIAGGYGTRNRKAIRATLQELSELANPAPPPHRPQPARPLLDITPRPRDS
jgi:hypothetical protein